jgi:hypothetical protein
MKDNITDKLAIITEGSLVYFGDAKKFAVEVAKN